MNPRHFHVRHPDEPRAEHFAADALAVGLVGEREDGVGVRVIDIARWQVGVEERLDAGGRRAGVEEVRAELVHHVLVAHGSERAVGEEGREADGGVSRRLDGGEVPARPLDEEDLDDPPEKVRRLRLDRRIAAAVDDERRVCSEEPRRVRAERERFSREVRGDGGGEVGDGRGGVRVGVAGMHGGRECRGEARFGKGSRGRAGWEWGGDAALDENGGSGKFTAFSQARSSVVERYLDTVDVVGSTPIALYMGRFRKGRRSAGGGMGGRVESSRPVTFPAARDA